ncbi:MAG: hypothetical protein EHM79_09680 [Geobacter sp.]|nr:MAG: hypothetical protein EHM79_09680 [Geobacter sp.]
MSAHFKASVESRNLCESLFLALKRKIAKLERGHTKQWCALYELGGNRFAYISHRKTDASIQIWCAGDVDALKKNPYIKVLPRDNIKKGWEERFPARFSIEKESQVQAAAELLFSISYKAF